MNFFEDANITTQLIESSLIEGSQCLVPRMERNESLVGDIDLEDVKGTNRSSHEMKE